MLFDQDARTAIFAGVAKVAKAVKSTLGPTGRSVIIKDLNRPPIVTKDGVTVAKSISLEDPFENLGAELLISVASKTADVAGDGTTSATVLAEAILCAGQRLLASEAKAIDLKKGIDAAVEAVEKSLDEISTEISTEEEMAQVATISANNDEVIGKLLAGVIAKVGADGVVTVEENNGVDTVVETVEGMEFDRGFITPFFVNKPDTGESNYENPLIFVYGGKISAVKDIATGNGSGLIDRVLTLGKPFIIIADDVDGDALTLMCVNRQQRGLPISAVKAPGFGDAKREALADIAAVCGTKVFSKEAGDILNEIDLENLGNAKRLISTRSKTLIVDGAGKAEAIQSRVAAIQTSIEKSNNEGEIKALKKRMAKLNNGIAVVKVGGTSEIEMREKKDRVEDALYATQAAVEAGVVPGGGVALVKSIAAVDILLKTLTGDAASGAQIIRKALSAPLCQIAENAGQSGGAVQLRWFDLHSKMQQASQV
jgi:chaperonin GroEL